MICGKTQHFMEAAFDFVSMVKCHDILKMERINKIKIMEIQIARQMITLSDQTLRKKNIIIQRLLDAS